MKVLTLGMTSSLMALCAALTTAAHAADTPSAPALKPILESNLRLETVDQQDIARKAEALTWRNRIGFQTAEINHFTALFEAETTAPLVEHYNSTVNGKTQYPGVNDPDVTELNRAQITWAPDKITAVTFGRQRIVLDDARFVGNAGWRQDEQTFDALRLDTGTGRFKVTAAYVSRVNRVIGDEKDWNSNSWLINASYDFGPALKLTGFDYSLRFTAAAKNPTAADATNARASSVDIAGLRAAGSHKYASGSVGYVAQYARESDGHGNPQNFHLSESMFEVNGSYKMLTGRINYESLGGNGTVGFVAPLASPHPFQGFADAFSATGGNKTFVDGIRDLSETVTVNIPGKLKPALSLTYHDFDAVHNRRDLASEVDVVGTAALTPQLSLMVKYADFHKDDPSAPASRNKTWLILSYKM